MSNAKDYLVSLGYNYEVLDWKTRYSDPYRFKTEDEFKLLMLETIKQESSDIYIQPDQPVLILVHGEMKAVTHRPLDDTEVSMILRWTAQRDTAETDIRRREPVNARYECFSEEVKDQNGKPFRHGWRVNASPITNNAGISCQIVMRAIEDSPPLPEKVGLTEQMLVDMTPHDGIVYVAGATGSGKSTTFASVIRHILEHDTPIKGNLITHEEPIEYNFTRIRSKHSVIVQSQIPTNFNSFSAANREAMRRRPGLIMVGELRDEETISAAVEAALTGHPVYGTVHAVDVSTVVRRVISRFPEALRSAAIYDIIDTARYIMAQRLVKATNGRLTALREYLVFSPEVREQLYSISDTDQITHAVANLVYKCGHSFAADIKEKYDAQIITLDVAKRAAKALGVDFDG